jgi:hypothetical protein
VSVFFQTIVGRVFTDPAAAESSLVTGPTVRQMIRDRDPRLTILFGGDIYCGVALKDSTFTAHDGGVPVERINLKPSAEEEEAARKLCASLPPVLQNVPFLRPFGIYLVAGVLAH